MTQFTETETVEELPEKKWSIEEYDQLVEQGFFDGQRLELIYGRIVQMSPQLSKHMRSTELVNRYCRRSFGENYWVRIQGPLKLSDDSEPEPDIAVVELNPVKKADHPRNALLVVEVSDSTLRKDRKTKKKLYASNGIQEYWIVNLVDRILEVHRDPDTAAGNYRYNEKFLPGTFIAPLAASGAPIDVAEIIP